MVLSFQTWKAYKSFFITLPNKYFLNYANSPQPKQFGVIHLLDDGSDRQAFPSMSIFIDLERPTSLPHIKISHQLITDALKS